MIIVNNIHYNLRKIKKKTFLKPNFLSFKDPFVQNTVFISNINLNVCWILSILSVSFN